MRGNARGSLRLFRLAGVNVFLHWTWFPVALYEIEGPLGKYPSITWKALEYLALFLIVLLHEYGHALACRQVGGKVTQIVLWPLGGLAYVDPPPRPGATLWSIAAGPLVNVTLIPILLLLAWLGRIFGWYHAAPTAAVLLNSVFVINIVLLVFNILPIYPLDGGQILRSLLWFVMGRARSLMVATVIGLVGVAAVVIRALWSRSLWLGVISLFLVMNCWRGLKQSIEMLRSERAGQVPKSRPARAGSR